MASPVDHLGRNDAGDECGADDEPRGGPPAGSRFVFGFGRAPSCGPDGATVALPGACSVRWAPRLCARALIRLGFSLRRNAASLLELLGQPCRRPRRCARPRAGELLEALGAPFDDEIGVGHFFCAAAPRRSRVARSCRRPGGRRSSRRREAGERPVQSSLRSMLRVLPGDDVAKPASYSNSMEPRRARSRSPSGSG